MKVCARAVWQPKIAPKVSAANNVGFVMLADDGCLPHGTTARDTPAGTSTPRAGSGSSA